MILIEINFNEISKHAFKIIDIRVHDNYYQNHLDNAINIPFTKLIIEPEKYLNKHDFYLLICEYGIKSKKTANILRKLGYHVFSLSGGMKEIK